MLNPELPQRIPSAGPPAALAVSFPADVVERFVNALHEWRTEQAEQTDEEV